MASRYLAAAALAAVCVLPSCTLSPRWDASGVWSVEFVRSGALFLDVRQSGDSLAGTACYVAAGMIVFRGAAIQGAFPDFAVDIGPDDVGACCRHFIGARLEGVVISRDKIAARWSDSTASTGMAFRRTETVPSLCTAP